MLDPLQSLDRSFPAPQSMELSKQEYWSGLPFLPPEDLPDTRIKPASLASPALAGRFFTTSAISEAQGMRVGDKSEQAARPQMMATLRKLRQI